MPEKQDEIIQLHQRLENLLQRQASFQRELEELRNEIQMLTPTETPAGDLADLQKVIPEISTPVGNSQANS